MIEKNIEFDKFDEDTAIKALQEHYTINEPKSLTNAFNKGFKNKQWIKDCFGGSSIIRKEFTITEDSDHEAKKTMENEIALNIMNELRVHSYALKSFLLNYCDLSKNKVIDSYTIYSSKNKKISKGSNVSRSLKYFIEDKELLRKFQDMLSQLIQKSSYEGKKYYMYLSINPNDFLTVSNNTKNWTSCHSLREDYYFGNFAYLSDKTTIVAYVLDEKDNFENDVFDVNDGCGDGYKWNSKIWRSLVHITKDENNKIALVINKQYPFKSFSFNRELKKMIEEVFNFDYSGSNTTCTSDIFRVGAGGEMIFFDPIQSSDFSTFAHFDPNYSFSNIAIVAEAIDCINCGDDEALDGHYGTCDSCSELYYDEEDDDYSCHVCGQYYHISELTETKKDGYICDNCFADKNFEICSSCNYAYPKSTMSHRLVVMGNHTYTASTCRKCQEILEREREEKKNEQKDYL